MKIPIKKSKAPAQSPWHQDFRNADALPDIKVIRTRFFVNFVALVIPLFVAIMWIQNEMSLNYLKGSIAELAEEKASMQSTNNELVELSREFLKESAKIESLDEYYYNLFPVSDYLVTLSDQVREDMVVSSLELKKSNRVSGNDVIDVWESRIAGYVAHVDQEAITRVNNFVEEIGKEELLEPHIDEAFLDNLARDQETDTLNFVVSITMLDSDLTGDEDAE
ncbi:MAG: hypothetical protein P8L44_19200 [Opitutales bacterium]|jgi:hypothetical protein|nr:hypothetical protein [Opitutales bacterium]MDG2170041.1 hypothetical protein [Opitutales bacterium]